MPRGYWSDHPTSFMSSIQSEEYSYIMCGGVSMVLSVTFSRTCASHTHPSARPWNIITTNREDIPHGIKSIIFNLVAVPLVSYGDLHALDQQ